MKALADNFAEITDEETVKRIFASKWQQREKGYAAISDSVMQIYQSATDKN